MGNCSDDATCCEDKHKSELLKVHNNMIKAVGNLGSSSLGDSSQMFKDVKNSTSLNNDISNDFDAKNHKNSQNQCTVIEENYVHQYFHNVEDFKVRSVLTNQKFKYGIQKLDKLFENIQFRPIKISQQANLNKNKDSKTRYIITNTKYASFLGAFTFDDQESIEQFDRSEYIDFEKGKAVGRYVVLNGGGCYEGYFNKGLFSGKGILISSDGDCYRGYFTEGKINGRGSYENHDGSQVYDGYFKDFDYHGYGKLTKRKFDKTDTVYTGNFKDGKESDEHGLYACAKFSYYGKFSEGKFNDPTASITFKDGKLKRIVSLSDHEINDNIYEIIQAESMYQESSVDDHKLNTQGENKTIVSNQLVDSQKINDVMQYSFVEKNFINL